MKTYWLVFVLSSFGATACGAAADETSAYGDDETEIGSFAQPMKACSDSCWNRCAIRALDCYEICDDMPAGAGRDACNTTCEASFEFCTGQRTL